MLIRFCTDYLKANNLLKDAVALMEKYCGDALLIKNDDGFLVGVLTSDEVNAAIENKVPLTTPIKALLTKKDNSAVNIANFTEISNSLIEEIEVLNGNN